METIVIKWKNMDIQNTSEDTSRHGMQMDKSVYKNGNEKIKN